MQVCDMKEKEQTLVGIAYPGRSTDYFPTNQTYPHLFCQFFVEFRILLNKVTIAHFFENARTKVTVLWFLKYFKCHLFGVASSDNDRHETTNAVQVL